MSVFGSLAAAAGSGALDFGSSYIMGNHQYSQSKKAAATAFLYQNYLMDKQNEYNKPINQMKRLEEAGLNPNLVYGGGATTLSASSGSAPMATAGHYSSDGVNFLEKMALVKNLEKVDADTRAVDNSIKIANADLELRRQLNNAQIASLHSNSRNNNALAHQTELNNSFWDSLDFSRSGVDTVKAGADVVKGSGGFWQKAKQFARNVSNFKLRRLK